MPRSYQIFSLGFIVLLGLSLGSQFKNRPVKQESKASRQVLTMLDTFKTVEAVELPNFQHVVINFPRHLVFIHQSDHFDGIKIKSQVQEIGLEEFITYQIQSDTLYIEGKMDLQHFDYTNSHGYTYPFREAEAGQISPPGSIRLSIQAKDLKSITLLEEAKAEIYMQFANYTDSNWTERIIEMRDIEQLAFQKTQLDLEIHEDVYTLINGNVSDLDVQYQPKQSPLGFTAFNGHYQNITLDNPAGQMNRISMIVDSLYVLGGPQTTGSWFFNIKDYLYTDLYSKQKVGIEYKSHQQAITVEGNSNRYHYITETK